MKMRHLRALCVCIAFVGGAAAAVPAAARWREVRTPNFLLIGDARAGDMKRIAARFEQFHGAMENITSTQAVTSPVPTVVLVFGGEASFRPYMPVRDGRRVDVAGVFWSGRAVNYVGINAAYGERAYPVVFHELTHVLTANSRRRLPLWLTEGIAEYHSTFEVRGPAEILLGRPIGHHTLLLRDQFIPLRELLAVDEKSPIYSEGPRRSLFYAQSWALVHLLRNSPDTRGGLSRYVRAYEAGTEQQAAMRDVFGFEVPELEQRLRTYVRQFAVRGELWKLPQPITDTALTDADVPEGVALTHLGRLLLRANRVDEAEERFRAALLASPKLAVANAAMAELRLQQERPGDAWAHLETASAGAADFFDHYLVASALDQLLEAAPSEAERERALSSLRERAAAATAARPDVAEAWHLLAAAALQSGDREEAGRAIERAVSLAPGHERYRFVLANVLSQRGEFARARSLLGELMAGGQTEAVRRAAREFMASVVRREQYAKTVGPGAGLPDDSAPVPVFREVQPGETRISGLLAAIECTPGGVTLVVRAEDRTLRITTGSFDAMEFITYRADLTGQVTCSPRNPPDPVLVTWPGEPPAGDAVQTPRAVVEFTPKRAS